MTIIDQDGQGSEVMLKLEHFLHLPQLDALLEQIAGDGTGLVLVAGLDPRAARGDGDGFLPSGRSTFFRILMREVLTHEGTRAIAVARDRAMIRIPRQFRRRVEVSLVRPPETYAGLIADAVQRRPDLLVIDRLDPETLQPVLEAALGGLKVLSQMDTVFAGAAVARHLLNMGVTQEQLGGLAWVVAVQRLATLCPTCKEPVAIDGGKLAELHRRYPKLGNLVDRALAEGKTFSHAPGCADCQQTGRKGDVACFDVFCADVSAPRLLEQPSVLSMQEYVLHLAALSELCLDDVLSFDTDQLRRSYGLLSASEQELVEANAALQRKLTQLASANRVLQQRTEALISFQDIGRALIATTHLDDLATRVCRYARDLCGADRVVLYLLRADGMAEVLAVHGWRRSLVHQHVDVAPCFGTGATAIYAGSEPMPFTRLPPGVLSADAGGVMIKAGLCVPLTAERKPVGVMVVHTTQKTSFLPGEVALLQTFASQAAAAVQRAGLIEQLEEKIVQLEAAQAELIGKERLERELELARQVQQSVLPRVFPKVRGYSFAVCSQPAREVGGDFYDVFMLDAGSFGVVVADVSDKGMPAALYMALTRSLLLAEACRGATVGSAEPRSPRAVLTSVNRLLQRLGEPNMFVSVFYGIVEAASRRLTYTRAGHDRPLLLRGGTVRTLGGEGAVLGLLDESDLHLSEEQVVLMPADRLVLYTDGLTDVIAPDDSLFGLERFRAVLQSHGDLSPDELCSATFADLAAYQGEAEQHDDMTMLAVGLQ